MLEELLQRRPYNAAADLIDGNIARGLSDKIAFADGRRTLTYSALQDHAYRFGWALRKLGVREESRLLLIFHDSVDYPVAFLGAIRAGIIPIPLNTLLTAEQYEYV